MSKLKFNRITPNERMEYAHLGKNLIITPEQREGAIIKFFH